MGWAEWVDLGLGSNAPAVWLYPQKECDVEVGLKFHGKGFMTMSAPAYNDKWRIHVDPNVAYGKYSETYGGGQPYLYLDYDGFRDGPFQREAGWCIAKEDLLRWQRGMLHELGFTETEIDDVNYAYGRLLLARNYPESFFAIYPQEQKIVDKSVSLDISPKPDTLYRLWFYFVPVNAKLNLPAPNIKPVKRQGFTAVELGFLSDREIPKSLAVDPAAQTRMLVGHSQFAQPRK
jgi:hypothetical protein